MFSDPLAFVIACAVMGVAAFAHGYTGFGFGVFSVALFALLPVNLEWAAAVLTVLALFVLVTLFFLSRGRAPVRWRSAVVIWCGAVFGTPLGYAFLAAYKDAPFFRIAIGLVLLSFGVLSLRPPPMGRRLHPVWGVGLGALGGAISGAMASGGPPVIWYLYSQVEDPRDMKSTAQVTFIGMTIFRLCLIGFRWGAEGTQLVFESLSVLPLVALLLYLGHAVTRRTSVRTFRYAVSAMLCLAGLAAMGRASLLWLLSGK